MALGLLSFGLHNCGDWLRRGHNLYGINPSLHNAVSGLFGVSIPPK